MYGLVNREILDNRFSSANPIPPFAAVVGMVLRLAHVNIEEKPETYELRIL